MGDVDLFSDTDDTSRLDIDIDMMVKYPEFTSSPLMNDIALFRLEKPVIFNGEILRMV